MSDRFKSNQTISSKLQRITTKVNRTEKKASVAAANSATAVGSAAMAARAAAAVAEAESQGLPPNSVGNEQLGTINQIISDYNLDLIVGEDGYVTLSGGNYDTEQSSLLGYDAGSVVQVGVPLRYATVDPTYESGQARVRFDGETTLSGPYRYISGYVPVGGDRVVLHYDYVSSYVISGKLLP